MDLTTFEETRQLYLAGGEVRFEQQPTLKASMSDLSNQLILRYRNRREHLADFAIELSNEELLHNLGCIVSVRRVIGFEGVDYWEFPKEAIREVVVNAVIHRDYSLQGQHIRIFIFDDRIEVYSPGLLPPGVILEELRQLKSRSVLRNPTIVNIFRDFGGFIEKLGTGIRRMSNAMQGHHLPTPQFDN